MSVKTTHIHWQEWNKLRVVKHESGYFVVEEEIITKEKIQGTNQYIMGFKWQRCQLRPAFYKTYDEAVTEMHEATRIVKTMEQI